MIDWLRTAKSAHFYKKRRRLPKTAIEELFRSIREKSDAVTRNIFSHVKEQYGHSQWSAIAFFYERDPSFLVYQKSTITPESAFADFSCLLNTVSTPSCSNQVSSCQILLRP